MLKLIVRTTLVSTMGFSWALVGAGGRAVEAAGRWGAEDEHAGLVEMSVWKLGHVIRIAGEGLELRVNGWAVQLGYSDGEISGMVAWPPVLAS